MIIANTTQYFQGTLQSLSHLITSATPRDRDLYYPFLNDVNMRLREIISSHQVNLERKDKKGPWTLNQQVCIYLALNPKGSYFSLFPKSNQSPNLLFFSSMSISFPSGLHPAGWGEGCPEVVSLREGIGPLHRMEGRGGATCLQGPFTQHTTALFTESFDQDCVFVRADREGGASTFSLSTT